ncbi:MAG: hypothetical protein WC980_10170 [Candidatus Brocadiia bacterium]
MLYSLTVIGLFVLATAIISTGLGLSIASDNPRDIIKTAWKNFRLLCILVIVICIAALIINH